MKQSPGLGLTIKTHECLSFCDNNSNKNITTHSINLRLPITLDYLLKQDSAYHSAGARPEADDRQLIQVGIHWEGIHNKHILLTKRNLLHNFHSCCPGAASTASLPD